MSVNAQMTPVGLAGQGSKIGRALCWTPPIRDNAAGAQDHRRSRIDGYRSRALIDKVNANSARRNQRFFEMATGLALFQFDDKPFSRATTFGKLRLGPTPLLATQANQNAKF